MNRHGTASEIAAVEVAAREYCDAHADYIAARIAELHPVTASEIRRYLDREQVSDTLISEIMHKAGALPCAENSGRRQERTGTPEKAG